jgi:uncharacterized protein (TIGR02246 family)
MLRPLFISLMLPVFAVPAMAQDVKQEVEKVGTAYQECMGKHDAACVASLYSKDGVQINPNGVFSDIKALYEQNFKNGSDRLEGRTDHVRVVNNDLVLADGDADVFIKNDKGETNKVTIFWSAVDTRENGQLKIRMLTWAPKPPPAKEAAADNK